VSASDGVSNTVLRFTVIALLAGSALALVGPSAPVAKAEVVWLCKPGEEPNPCRESLTTTVQAPDGSTRVEDPPLPAAPPIDTGPMQGKVCSDEREA